MAEREAAERDFRRARSSRPLKGVGGGGGELLAIEGGNGDAAPMVRAAPTEEQRAQIEIAIKGASSIEEMQAIERAMKAGNYAFVAKAAEKAAAAAAAGGGAGS